MELKKLELQHKKVILKISDFLNLGEFYLAGGTAVYYYLRHRKSLDLDFFTNKIFDFRNFKELFNQFETSHLNHNTIYTTIEDIKVSFFHYPYPLLKPLNNLEIVKVASLEDIGAMKVLSIIQRGSKKDFVDLYFIINTLNLSINDLIKLFTKKYGKFNPLIIHKALVFFDDADNEPDLMMIKKTDWSKIKKYFMFHFGKLN
ncbi:MAG: nucleotidyl transferase AbiEii/AbiGii toxin family protein [Thermodesulfovibrio sp.]|uniref:nucleotidyl transferase AbiEii/AbiGii toxin family protein n=1 Tax=Thermodesulfovibrio sp. 1176 TaxID=3043424 RepID=UPI0024825EDD|nr:nucleotidyl transferase AbiEii/AbiGii toxin family protein [Thermodesulfovibrio sp. 1176]MDI1471666.1 nucleotidyl transferase AbiEii/AbiGii toxin family protein [Thermodesulfovibrio sp. 1176]MDI6713558.1 nucleotidyl transferase AbiEii/AbiGii toxin family protein [Thermodesulfovibrio sp.]